MLRLRPSNKIELSSPKSSLSLFEFKLNNNDNNDNNDNNFYHNHNRYAATNSNAKNASNFNKY